MLGWAAGWHVAAVVARGAEWRAWWVDAFHPGMKSATQVAQLVADARRANMNALVVQVRRRGDAYYQSSLEPKAADVTPQSFDPLAELLRVARDTSGGKPRLDVHAWIVTYNIWNAQSSLPSQASHPYRTRPAWLTRDASGATWDGSNYAFDPAHPEVQDHTVAVALDLVGRYAVDGLHLDYIRYNGSGWGYHPVAVDRFQRRHGRTTRPAPTDLLWKQFRRDEVTALVRRIYLATTRARPSVRLSAATITFAPGITTTSQWTTSAAYGEVLQDWRAWMEEGILDVNMPMAYFRQGSNGADWAAWGTFAKNHRYGRHVVLGAATYLNAPADSLLQLRSTRVPTAAGGAADGLALYSYASPANDGTTRAAWIDALRSGLPGDAWEPLLAKPEEVPAMPWKDAPGKGHLLGRLPGSDGVAVTLAGPVARVLRTDGNGWFGAVGLEPGEARVSAVVGGARWVAVARVEAGKVAEPRWFRADDDDDGDGMANEDELMRGGDPGLAADVPRAVVARRADGFDLVLPRAVPGREFTAWHATTLGPGAAWSLVGRVTTTAGQPSPRIDVGRWMTSGEAGFFRLDARWAP